MNYSNQTTKNQPAAIRVRSQVHAGALVPNHNQSLRVRSGVRAGGGGFGSGGVNHNQSLRVRSGVRAGTLFPNHNQSARR